MNISKETNGLVAVPMNVTRYSKMYGSLSGRSGQVLEGIATLRHLVLTNFSKLDRIKGDFAQVDLVDKYTNSRHGSKRIQGVYVYDSEGVRIVSVPALILFGDANIVHATSAFLKYLGYSDVDVRMMQQKIRDTHRMRNGGFPTEEYDYSVVVNIK